jgi:hypothetical protein
MRRAVLVTLALALALPGAAAARTTKLISYSLAGHHPQGWFAPGDDVRVIARNFIPPPLCKAKVRFTFRDAAGDDTRLGSYKPRFGHPQGLIVRKVGEVPAGAAFGRGSVRSRQSCNVGTASGRDSVMVVDPARAPPRATAATATGAESGQRAKLSFRIDREAMITLTIDFELVPGVWREIDRLLDDAFYKSAGTYTADWRARVGGFVPAGSYRFRIAPHGPAGRAGEAVGAPFTVRPRTPPPPKDPGATERAMLPVCPAATWSWCRSV